MKDNIDRIPELNRCSLNGLRGSSGISEWFPGFWKVEVHGGRFTRTGASSLHSGDDGLALGGTMKAPCSFIYRSSLHFSYRNFPPSFYEGYVARLVGRSKRTLSG